MFRTKYMGPAGIPDSTGGNWATSSPDVLDENEIAGLTTTDHQDGALFTEPGGVPAYSMIATYHWSAYPLGQYGGGGELNPDEGCIDTVATDNAIETVAEIDRYLQYGAAHVYAQCVAVEALENDIISTTPTVREEWIYGGYGHWLTTGGFKHTANTPLSFINEIADAAAGQSVGDWTTLNSSDLAAFGLNDNSQFYGGESSIIVLDRVNLDSDPNYAYPLLFMNGFYKGVTACGKVTYMTGHESSPALPYSTSTSAPMLRYFYNSLFESPAAFALVPEMYLTKTGPAEAEVGMQVTYNITYNNVSGIATDVVLTDPYPTNATYVSCTGGGVPGAGVVTWNIGNLEDGGNGSVSVTYLLNSAAGWDNQAHVTYKSGLTQFTRYSDSVHTTMVVFTATPTVTPTITRTATPTVTPTFSSTLTATPTVTPTYTSTATPTYTASATVTPTMTLTGTVSPTVTISATSTHSATVTQSASITMTSTVSVTFTSTPSITFTPTQTASFTVTPTANGTYTDTPTMTNTLTNTLTNTPTGTPTVTVTPTATGTMTATPTPSVTQSPTLTSTSTPSETMTITVSASPTASETMTATMTATWSTDQSATPTLTETPDGSLIGTVTSTATYTQTPNLSEINIIVYPNPFNPAVAANGELKIIGLDPNDKVTIFTVSGEKIAQLENQQGRCKWNGTNQSQTDVVNGVYIYLVYRNGSVITSGKIFVTR